MWRWHDLNQIRHFFWLVAHDWLLTNEERRRHKLTEDDSCSRCEHIHEIILHVLRDCSYS
ncbi:hypothetical protein LINPERHAP1_LOCUS25265 [Linum perenne]